MNRDELLLKVKECSKTLQKVLFDEQDYYDNMPDSLQFSIRGMDSEFFIDNMEDADASLDNIIELLEGWK